MPRFLPKNRQARIATLVIGSTLLIAGLALFAIKVVKPYARAWRENRTIEVAKQHFQQNDPASALLAIRQVLGKNPNNIEALKMAVDICEKQNSPDIVSFQNNLAKADPTLANKVKFLNLAVKYGAYRMALETIEKMGPEAASSAEFHKLAAQTLHAAGDRTKAKYHLMSLVSLQPDDQEAKLDLAQLRLIDGFTDNKPAIRAEIRRLSSNPELRVRALTLLLNESLQNQDAAQSLEYADQLALTPSVDPRLQLLIAEAYRVHAPNKFLPYVRTLQTAYAQDATKVIGLGNLLVNNGNALIVRTWIDALDEKVRSAEGVQLIYAFALLNLKEINTLETYLRGFKWTENEYARQALLAYTYRHNGNDNAFNDAWKLATIDASSDQRKLFILISQVLAWGWDEQKFELLWKRFSLDPRHEDTRRQLIVHELSKGNTLGLNRLYSRITEIDPQDKESKNNYAYTSLLLNQNPERAYQIAEEIHKSDPANPHYTTTHAFALSRQGKAERALETINTLDYAAKLDLPRTIIRSSILVQNGMFKEASDALRYLKIKKVLPEEKRLYENTLQQIAQNSKEKGQAEQLATFTQSNTENRQSWLALIPNELKIPGDLKQQLAEKLYGDNDTKALEAKLRSEKWDENDFLRLALLSYAQRKIEKESEFRSNWKFATTLTRNNPTGLRALLQMAQEWKWTDERMDLLNRLYQNDPLNQAIFDELQHNLLENRQTTELARLYQTRIEARPNDTNEKALFAYYSLLTGNNLSRANIYAKEAYDANTSDQLAATVYAYSLGKQNRASDGLKLLDAYPDRPSTGHAQLSLHKAILAAALPGNRTRVQALLTSFDPKSALPEEIAIAESLAQQNIAK